MTKNYSVFTDKNCIVYLKDGTTDKGIIETVVNEGDDVPEEQYILLKKGIGYYFSEIERIEPIK